MRQRQRGFTLMEMLVVVGLIGVIIAVFHRPILEMLRNGMAMKRQGQALTDNLLVLDLLAKDIRVSRYLKNCNSQQIVCQQGQGAVVWEFQAGQGVRTVKERKVQFPMAASGFEILPRQAPPATRHVLIRGMFEGLGPFECGVALRTDTDAL